MPGRAAETGAQGTQPPNRPWHTRLWVPWKRRAAPTGESGDGERSEPGRPRIAPPPGGDGPDEDDHVPVPLRQRIALLVALLITAGAAPFLGAMVVGADTYVIISDSMEPEIERGDMIITTERAVSVGSVIVFEARTGEVIAHRVIAINEIDGVRTFETRGDANPSADSFAIPADDVRGVVTRVIPNIGWPWLAIGPTIPWVLMLLIDAYVLMALWEARRQGKLTARHVAACAVVVLIACIPPASAAITLASPPSDASIDVSGPSPVAMEAGPMAGASIHADANSATIELPAERLWKEIPLWACHPGGSCVLNVSGAGDPLGTDWTMASEDWDPAPTFFLETVGNATGSVTASLQRFDPVAGWYDADWPWRKSVTVNASQVDGDQTDFPVLIDVQDAELTAAQASGQDILFTDTVGTKLDHELEAFDDGTGALRAWVKADIQATSNTTLYLYYGNPAASDQQNVAGTWSNGFTAVWHMDEDPGAGDSVDSVAGHSATPQGSMTSGDLASGAVGNGIDFDGTNDHFEVCDADCAAALNITDDSFTLTGWAYVPAAGVNDDEGLISKFLNGNDERYHLGIDDDAGSTDQVNCRRTSSGSQARVDEPGVARGEWVFLACTYDGTDLKAFVNGAEAGSLAATGSLDGDNGDSLLLGKRYNARYFEGSIDELRISDTARDATWLATEFANQNDPAAFATISAQQSHEVAVALPSTAVSSSGPSTSVATSAPFTLSPGRHTVHVDSTGGSANLTTIRLIAYQDFPESTRTDVPLAFAHRQTSVGWYDGDWAHRSAITIDHAYVKSDLTAFPVLVEVQAKPLGAAQADGDDFLFTDSQGAKLAHEIESWNATEATLRAWVRADVDADAETTLYLYYGNSAATNQENVVGTWSNGFAAVWHVDEDPSSADALDALGAANATPAGAMTRSDLVAGQIGDAIDLDGTDDHFVVCNGGCSGSIDLSGDAFTLTGWVRVPAAGVNADEGIISKFENGNDERFHLGIDDDPGKTDQVNCRRTSAGGQVRVDEPGVTRDAWVHVACRYDGATLQAYIDGAEVGSSVATGSLDDDPSDQLLLGKRYDARYFEGSFDELRIHSVARSAAWISTEHANQLDPASFASLGVEEDVPATLGFEIPDRAALHVHDSSAWDGTTNFQFEVLANGSGSVRLWDRDAATAVAEVAIDATEPTRFASTVNLTHGNEVVVQVKANAGGIDLRRAGLVVTQSSFNATVGFLLMSGQEQVPGGAWQEMGDPDRHRIDSSWGHPATRFEVTVDPAGTAARYRLVNGTNQPLAGSDLSVAGSALARFATEFNATTNQTYQVQGNSSLGHQVSWAVVVHEQNRTKTWDHLLHQDPPVAPCTWEFRLQLVGSTGLGRLDAATWSLRGDTTESQILIEGGVVTQSVGTAVTVSDGNRLEHLAAIRRNAAGSSTVDVALLGECGGVETRQALSFALS